MSFIEQTNLRIGSHLGFSKQLLPTIEKAIDYEMGSCQFFLGNNKSFTRQKLSQEDIDKCRALSDEYMLSIFSHYPYTSSLLGTKDSLAWSGDKIQDAKSTKVVQELEYELYALSQVSETNGVVVHPGSFPVTNDGLDTIAKTINKIKFAENSKLLLENSASEGTKIPRNFKEMKRIFDGIDGLKKDYVGCCIDTAHIQGSGIYDLRKRDEVDKMFHDFDKYIGLDKFDLLHLNDSEVKLGAKKDRHSCIGFGKIWEEDNESLKYLLTKCSEKFIPVILETENGKQDLYNINNLSEDTISFSEF